MSAPLLDVEALIEFNGTMLTAGALAEAIRSEDGLSVRVRRCQNNHSGEPNTRLWVKGQAATYTTAETTIEHVKKIVQKGGDFSVAFSNIYRDGVAIYENGHAK